MRRVLIMLVIISSNFILSAMSNNLRFELITDKNISFDSDIDMDKVKNNVLISIEDGKITDKFFSQYGYPIRIESITDSIITIKAFIDNTILKVSHPPFVYREVILLSYSNGKFYEIFTYPELIDNQSGPNIFLQSIDFDSNIIKMNYKYIKNGQAKYESYGNISLQLEKICSFYYLSEYNCDVKGYFKYFDKETGDAAPAKDDKIYDFTVERNIQKEDFISILYADNINIIYNPSSVNKSCFVIENLRLRESESISSEIVTTLQKGSSVKIKLLGKNETIDGISSRWVYVEVQPGAQDRDGKLLESGIAGWCFGGYLK